MYNFALSICVHGGAMIALLTLSPLLAAALQVVLQPRREPTPRWYGAGGEGVALSALYNNPMERPAAIERSQPILHRPEPR
jgi:hypothetical protein